MSKLDQEEREILEAFDVGELKRSEHGEQMRQRHREYAEATSSERDSRRK